MENAGAIFVLETPSATSRLKMHANYHKYFSHEYRYLLKVESSLDRIPHSSLAIVPCYTVHDVLYMRFYSHVLWNGYTMKLDALHTSTVYDEQNFLFALMLKCMTLYNCIWFFLLYMYIAKPFIRKTARMKKCCPNCMKWYRIVPYDLELVTYV